MIDVSNVLRQVPHFETFCSVAKLRKLVESLRGDSRFHIQTLGESVGGEPIHHVRFGSGSLKALVVGGPHAMEPIGSLTVFSLLTLLHQRNRTLLDADIEWHVVPCIDPDGAVLNEGWTQAPFTFENYVKNFYLQSTADMVDTSFPIKHKRLVWEQPSREAALLKGLIDRVLPDFYYGLHNAWIGGAFYFISRDIDHEYHRELYSLLERHGVAVQRRPLWKEVCAQYGEGIVEMIDVTKHYDYVERTTPNPENVVRYGASSRYYLTSIKPEALTFVTEMGYIRHPGDESEKDTGQNLRKFQLRLDADNKYLGAILLEEWEKVKGQVDPRSPFYRAIVGGIAFPLDKERLMEGGMPLSWYPTRDLLFNSAYDKVMTEGDRFNACMINSGACFPRLAYQLVRLLQASPQSVQVRQSIVRLERAFDEALADIGRHVDFDAFEVIDCDTLAKVQLGSGLIVLNSMLEAQSRRSQDRRYANA